MLDIMKFENFEQRIVGKNAKGNKDEILNLIEKRWTKGREPFEGEPEKTPEELEVISTINDYIQQEFEELNLGDAPVISPEQVHILPTKIYKELTKSEGGGRYIPENNTSLCEKGTNRLQLYAVMLHESIHMVSAQKYYAKTKIERGELNEYRTGYGTKNVLDQHEHFRGLNEAVVENTTKDILYKNKNHLIEKFNITEEESRNTHLSYAGYRAILDVIIGKVAKRKGENKATTWKRIKKGQFTGEMMHLRDIEETFGKGGLRVLGALGSGTKNLPEEETNEKILQYFTTEDESERDNIAHEALNERERLRYTQKRT